MTITPAQLTAERLGQIAEARKLMKMALMDTIQRLAVANADPDTVTVKPEIAGQIARLIADIKALQQLAHDYESKAGIFEDYIL